MKLEKLSTINWKEVLNLLIGNVIFIIEIECRYMSELVKFREPHLRVLTLFLLTRNRLE